MTNRNAADVQILSNTIDYGNDNTLFQVQASALNVTESLRNFLTHVGNIASSAAQILSNTTRGFLTGRRPVSGQVFPRGVYNR